MKLDEIVAAMTPEIYANLRQAVETGKWLNGDTLSEEQKENAMQAVMLYQAKVAHSDEHMTVGRDGEIVEKSRQQLKQELRQQATKQTPIAKFSKDDI
ncbi:YeaC family protein [Agaribacter flavus]|uniref:YeaC family protein n=1 Tax=Agaribacter flavus TaxID=1902781 RepID=A0ABV7FNS2_9ALTE